MWSYYVVQIYYNINMNKLSHLMLNRDQQPKLATGSYGIDIKWIADRVYSGGSTIRRFFNTSIPNLCLRTEIR